MADRAAATSGDLHVRRATADDEAAVLVLARDALGWAGDERDARFFRWKHRENPFGESPMWIAEDGGQVAGFRTFLRWEFTGPRGERHRAVRAVDTATHPRYQGRGIFTTLTLRALDDLRDEGVGFVFNTPNEQSRPGYLKMGWVEVGRLPVLVRPRSPAAARRIVSARVPAAKWSEPAAVGEPAAEALARPEVDELVARLPTPPGLSTPRTPGYLRWRYGFGPLAYRVVTLGDDPARGMAVVRVRARGAARELVLCELLIPGGARDERRRLARRALRESGADYLIALGDTVPRRTGVRLPRQGPVLTYRTITGPARPPAFRLGLGDVELF